MCSFHVLILHFPWALLAFTRFGIQNLWKYFKYSTYRILNRRDQKGRFRYEKYLRVWNYYVAEPHLTTNIWDWGQTTVWRAVCGKSARTVPWRAVNKPYVPPELIQQVYTVYGVYTRFGVSPDLIWQLDSVRPGEPDGCSPLRSSATEMLASRQLHWISLWRSAGICSLQVMP